MLIDSWLFQMKVLEQDSETIIMNLIDILTLCRSIISFQYSLARSTAYLWNKGYEMCQKSMPIKLWRNIQQVLQATKSYIIQLHLSPTKGSRSWSLCGYALPLYLIWDCPFFEVLFSRGFPKVQVWGRWVS